MQAMILSRLFRRCSAPRYFRNLVFPSDISVAPLVLQVFLVEVLRLVVHILGTGLGGPIRDDLRQRLPLDALYMGFQA